MDLEERLVQQSTLVVTLPLNSILICSNDNRLPCLSKSFYQSGGPSHPLRWKEKNGLCGANHGCQTHHGTESLKGILSQPQGISSLVTYLILHRAVAEFKDWWCRGVDRLEEARNHGKGIVVFATRVERTTAEAGLCMMALNM